VRDGLKPVQRRILYAMLQNLNLKPSGSHRKSAAVVGEVLARFHPHGDIACYEAMVRMAQDFSLRYPLVDGQGNFGSLDGDNAAAYRYTEAKLREIALEILGEIDQETVPFRDNFDATVVEPMVLPSRIPNLLINGATGIAVGMATSIPPHNLKDTIKAIVELSKDSELSTAKLASIIKGPDFPTGCNILNTQKELVEMYETGRGSVRMRGEWEVEEQARGKRVVVVTSIPYAVNKATLVERIAGLIVDRKVPQIVDVRDESTDEVRVVIELAAGADAEVAMAYLFKNTPLESNFAVNMTALVPTGDGVSTRPELLSLKSCLQQFLLFREEVTQKRLMFERKQLLERIHILEGLAIIYDALDEAIKIVRKSEGRSDAAERLRERFKLSEIQSYAVVDMRIYQLSRTNIDEIKKELADKQKRVKEIDRVLKSKEALLDIVRHDLESLAEKFGDKRRSKLIKDNVDIEFDETAYVVHEDVHVVVSVDGWVKRIRRSNDLSSTRMREGDAILSAHALSTLDSLALFTSLGTLFVLKVSDVPASSGYGTPIQKILKFKDGERIVGSYGIVSQAQPQAPGTKQAELPLGGASAGAESGKSLKEGDTFVLVGHLGTGFALTLTEVSETKRIGRRVMKLREGETMAAVEPLANMIVFVTRSGSALAIDKSEIPVRDSAAVGVSLMGVRDDDAIVACCGVSSSKMKGMLNLNLKSGKVKEVPLSEVTKGHRALKGTKVYSRDDIEGARVVEA
jgi:DNA gyrase subunit A